MTAVATLLFLFIAPKTATAADSDSDSSRGRSGPIMLDQSGGFQIGGVTIRNPENASQSLSCDHGYMEYFIPWTPRKTTIVMWHSSSTQVWQNRWDGGEGFKDKFLRRDYPVYLWDGPRVGRANWACAPMNYTPAYRDEGNFVAWNFGPRYKEWFSDVQFPTEDERAWKQATSARYDEFDNHANVQLQSSAAAVAADSGRAGRSIVYLTNSAGGLRAQLTAIKSGTRNVRGIVAYESIGFVFPDDGAVLAEYNITADHSGGFGPVVVPTEEFKRLARVRAIQFVWGDHRAANWTYVVQSRQCAELINRYGGNAEVLMLGDDAGIKGATHIPFADLSNERVARLLDRFLAKNRLDDYEDDGWRGKWRRWLLGRIQYR